MTAEINIYDNENKLGLQIKKIAKICNFTSAP